MRNYRIYIILQVSGFYFVLIWFLKYGLVCLNTPICDLGGVCFCISHQLKQVAIDENKLNKIIRGGF